MRLLKFESRERMFGLEGAAQPFNTNIGVWRIFEIYEPDAHKDVRPGLGSYRVVLEAEASTREELRSLNQEGIVFCEEFEVAWLYVWGMPLHGFGWTRAMQVRRPPTGWATNYEELQKELSPIGAIMTVRPQHWIYFPFLPLERAVRVREKIAGADNVLRTLIRLHHRSHTAGSMEGAIFCLCKGLEIVREILPGKSAKKEENLPAFVRGALGQPLHQLFGMANNHLETRHAVRTKGSSPSLHPPLGPNLVSFAKDLDLVLGAVVCLNFDEEPIVVREDRDRVKRSPP